MAEILEGFLCPLCMKDLGDVIQLQIHFEENHSKEDQAFVQSLKDLFGKAKKKILSEDEVGLDLPKVSKLSVAAKRADDVHPVSGMRTDGPEFIPAQPNTSHFIQFKKIRSERVDRYAAETNRLIVRLDRLLDGIPAEAGRRRSHEQAVVQWVEEDLVKLCPNCARSFNIARRKHHCRLCGSVMCKECSKFVEWDFCRKLINPSTLAIYSMRGKERQGWSVNGRSDTRSVGSLAKPSFRLRRSSSKDSVHSMLSDSKNAEEFRTCEYCLKLLKHRDAAIELQTVKPIITQFYERLREYTEEGTSLSVKYLEMSDSLCRGETTYHLSDAKTLRLKLLKLAEGVDLMSKKISALGTDTQSETYLKSRRFLLQTQIRRASVNFIKETLVGLPSLPSEEELVALRERRKEEIARRVEEERRRTQEARIKFRNLQEKRQETPKTKILRSPSEQAIAYEKGFVLSSANTGDFATNISDDPMVQQMNIIRNYISKAREANRFDEVSMLESNLRDLQIEYKKSKTQPVSNTPIRENHDHDHYESFNLDKSESAEQLPASLQSSRAGSNLLPTNEGSSNLSSKVPLDSVDGRNNGDEGGLPRRPSQHTAKPVMLEEMARTVNSEMARTVNSVRDYIPSSLKSLNPFGGADSDDEYDASGKNPFSE